jgi:signal transduction histidine kinase
LDLTTVLLQLAFYAVFAVSVWRYARRRGPLELSIVAVFGTFVALFLLSFVNGLAPALTPYVRPGLIAILFAQPYMVVRLIDQIEPVSHDGPGINKDEADKLFNLYFRAAQQATTAPGAGIGLFVCRELVAQMGGRIWAKARPEGGAEFGFSLPAYPDELEPVPGERRTPSNEGSVAPRAAATA